MSVPSHPLRPTDRTAAFTLVEIVFSLGLVVFVLVALLGLLGSGVRDVGESEKRIEVANLATTLLEARLATPAATNAISPLPPLVLKDLPKSTASALTGTKIIDAGAASADGKPGAYQLTYRIWRDVTAFADSQLVRFDIVLSWPAQANASKTGNRYELHTATILQP
jgi:type II secretory pathway pseudopilin PulG